MTHTTESRQHAINKRTRTVADNQRRIVFYVNHTPPVAYTITHKGYKRHVDAKWDTGVRAALIARGYSVQRKSNGMYVFDKVVGAKA